MSKNLATGKMAKAEADLAAAQDAGDTEATAQAQQALDEAQVELESHKEAVKNWAYMTAMGFLLLGPRGVPFYGVLAMLFDLGMDEDEDDFNTLVSKTLSEGMYYGLIARTTGMDITERASLTNLMIRDSSNYVPDSMTEYYLESYAGPAYSVTTRAIGGLYELLLDDDPRNNMRGLEKALPAGIANMLKAGRFFDEGYTTKRGDLIVDDLNMVDIARQAMGFRPVKFSSAQAELARNYRVTRGKGNRRASLLDRVWYQRDAEAGASADDKRLLEQDITEFNARYPDNPITQDTRKRSITARERGSETARILGGMVANKRDVREILESNEQNFRE